MKRNRTGTTATVLLTAAAACATTGMAQAQQITGTPGSPSATTTINGKQLPPPDPKFGGVIKEKASESKPWWPPRVVPPKGAPNVLLIMTDDCGFGAPEHVRRRHPDAGPGSHREGGAAVHAVPFHVALLADARGADHRPQPSRGRLWRRGRSGDGVSGLRLGHPEGVRHDRRRSSRRTATRPRGSARTTTRRSTRRARPGRSTNGRSGWASSTSTASSAATPASGSRTCSATRRPSIRFRAIPAGI